MSRYVLVQLLSTVFVRSSDKIFADSFTGFGGILSTPVAFLYQYFLKGLLYKAL